MKPSKLEAVYKQGAGWEIDATFDNGDKCHVLETEALVKSFAYAPWLDPFTPKEFEEMIGTVLTEMAESWNEKFRDKPTEGN